MTFSELLALLLVVGGLSTVIVIANRDRAQAQESPLLRALLYALTAGIATTGTLSGLSGLVNDGGLIDSAVAVNPAQALALLALTVLMTGVMGLLIASMPARQSLRAILPKSAGFDAVSPVHLTAIVLCISLFLYTLQGFVASGGISGLADQYQSGSVALMGVFVNQGVWLIAAFVGIGVFVRRSPGQAVARLRLRVPTFGDVIYGIGVGIGMYLVVIVLSLIWVALVDPEVFAAQTQASGELSAALTAAFGSLEVAFAAAVAIGVGEEVFFRGALQPVFGNLATSLFFTVLHTQYALTPATLAIFLTSLAFGWLHRRYSTTAAINAHIVYNFVQFALALTLGEVAS